MSDKVKLEMHAHLKEYYVAVEQMVCVWAGSDRPSSFLYSDRDAAADEDETEIWDRFVAARAAIRATQTAEEHDNAQPHGR